MSDEGRDRNLIQPVAFALCGVKPLFIKQRSKHTASNCKQGAFVGSETSVSTHIAVSFVTQKAEAVNKDRAKCFQAS